MIACLVEIIIFGLALFIVVADKNCGARRSFIDSRTSSTRALYATRMSGLLLPLGLLLFVLGRPSTAQNSGCYYNQHLQDGVSYYVYNSQYPNRYRGQNDCKWNVTSTYRVSLNCTDFEIPPSYDCRVESLSVQIGKNTTRKYCGYGPFYVESEGQEMTILFQSSYYSAGGRFQCELKSIVDNQNCQCGWKNPTRIVGGTETGINEYPMMAGIVDSSFRILICGATIISEQYVLTAAHCMKNRDYTTVGVIVGEHDTSTGAETNVTKLFKVAGATIHPKYTSAMKGYDICVIKIDGFIKFTNEIGPACLPFQHATDTMGGWPVDILGWGTQEFGGATSDVLMGAKVSVVTNLQCSRHYPGIRSDQMCTDTSTKDACQFDSGGPLLWQNPTTRNLVHSGIISYGTGCAEGTPAVNTRVGAFIDWIVDVTRDANYCKVE